MDYVDIKDAATLEAFIASHPDEIAPTALRDLANAMEAARHVQAAAAAAQVFGAKSFLFWIEGTDDGEAMVVDVGFRFNGGNHVDEVASVTSDADKKKRLFGGQLDEVLAQSGWGNASLSVDTGVGDMFRRLSSRFSYAISPHIGQAAVLAAMLPKHDPDPLTVAEAVDHQKRLAQQPDGALRRRRQA